LCWRVTGQITKFLINPFQCHSLCFLPGSFLSRCAQVSGQCCRLFGYGKRIVSSSHTGSARHRCLMFRRFRRTL
jgi:hypothetical protein